LRELSANIRVFNRLLRDEESLPDSGRRGNDSAAVPRAQRASRKLKKF